MHLSARALTLLAVLLTAALLTGCGSDDDNTSTADTGGTSGTSGSDGTSGTSGSDGTSGSTADTSGGTSGATEDTSADTSGTPTLSDGPGDFDPDFRTSAAFFTKMTAPTPGSSPHGTQQTWYSSNLEPVIDASAFTAPVGTVSIKVFDMDNDGTEDGIAVMIKKEAGYDTENQDWYYDMRDLDGNIKADPPAGKTAMCIGCHVNYAATDYLGATLLR